MVGGYYSFQGINGGARYHGTPVEEVLPVEILPYDDRVEVPEGFTPVDQAERPSDPARDSTATGRRCSASTRSSRRPARRSSRPRRPTTARSRCSSPARSARAARSPGPPTSARTGCRRNSRLGPDTRASGARRSSGSWAPASETQHDPRPRQRRDRHDPSRRALSAARRDHRRARRSPRISAARAPTRRSSSRVAACPCGSPRRSATTRPARRIRRSLEAEGVATHGLGDSARRDRPLRDPVDAAGENTIVSLIDAARAFDPAADAGLAESIAPGDWVLMQGNLGPAATRGASRSAKRRGAATALNPSPTYPRPNTTGASSISPSSTAARRSNSAAAATLSRRRARCSRWARGGRAHARRTGRGLVAGDGDLRAAAPAVAAVDTVGAGDVFCGALIASRAPGRAWSRRCGSPSRPRRSR